MIDGYELVPGVPDVDTYRRLRVAAGLSPKSEEQARIGLPNTWFGVTVRQGIATVGMGRIIGDGGTAFQIVDIALEPDHQGKGLGKAIMTALTDKLNADAPHGAYVSLIADGDAKLLNTASSRSCRPLSAWRGRSFAGRSGRSQVRRNFATRHRNCGAFAMVEIKSC